MFAAGLVAIAISGGSGAQVVTAELSIERRADGTRAALVRNALGGPLQVTVVNPAPPRERAEATLEAFETRAIGRFSGAASSRLRLAAQVGTPMPLPPEQRRPYAFPLPAEAAWRLTQGFGGRASHRDAANFHALDLAAAEGTPVLAARAGTVMQVIDSFHEGGMEARLRDRMNLVRVLHDDGSMGLYAHIAAGSARVRPGDSIGAGEALAAVGSVGWSSAPHLHFAVQFNDGRELLTLPFRMAAPDGRWLGERSAPAP